MCVLGVGAYLGIEDGVPASLICKDQVVLPQMIPQMHRVPLARLAAIGLAGAAVREEPAKDAVLRVKNWQVVVQDHL